MPLLSIVTVLPSNARGLTYTGRSLLVQQDAPEFQWLVMDTTAAHESASVMTEFADLHPIVIPAPESGVYDAMNTGIAHATGDYLWFLPVGDCLSDAYTLRDTAREIQLHFKPDFLYGGARSKGRLKTGIPFHALQRGNLIPHPAMLYRRIAVAGTRYSADYPLAADYAFTLEVAGRTPRIHAMKRVICDYEPADVSPERRLAERREIHAIRKELLNLPRWKNGFYFYLDGFKDRLFRQKP